MQVLIFFGLYLLDELLFLALEKGSSVFLSPYASMNPHCPQSLPRAESAEASRRGCMMILSTICLLGLMFMEGASEKYV